MKKVTLTGKLSLNKETVTKLNDAQMGVIKGGAKPSNGLCISTSVTKPCDTNRHSCLNSCNSWFNCVENA